jgi:hypothetical protein
MSPTPFNILVVLSIVLSVAGIIKPQWPLVAVAVLLLAIAVLVGK